MNPKRRWGTPELVACVQSAVRFVAKNAPGGARLVVGDLSAEHGGYVRPHASHQSGRDVDIGFYYKWGEAWYVKASRKNLDLERTWLLVKGLLSTCDIEYIFLDLRVQRWLREQALRTGEDEQWFGQFFRKRRGLPGIVRHRWGHLTHLHVRVHAPDSQARGERVGPLIEKRPWRKRQ